MGVLGKEAEVLWPLFQTVQFFVNFLDQTGLKVARQDDRLHRHGMGRSGTTNAIVVACLPIASPMGSE
eukprot:550525-Prorocentrum_minimum.AAC.1